MSRVGSIQEICKAGTGAKALQDVFIMDKVAK